jgi:hypothetical protein
MEDGIRAAAHAAVIQWEIDKNVGRYLENNVPKRYVEFAKRYAVWGKLIFEKRLEYEWKF